MELQITPEKPVEVTANFQEYKKMLGKHLKKFEGVNISLENAETIKKEIRPVRTALEKVQKTTIDLHFKAPEALFKSQMSELFEMVAQIEHKADDIISEETLKRNNELSEVFTRYVEKKVKELNMENDVIEHISFDKWYYNKTTKDKDIYNDIDRQLLEAKDNMLVYKKAMKVLDDLVKEFGEVFNYSRFVVMLAPYSDGNDRIIINAMEEGERLRNAKPNKSSVSVSDSEVNINMTVPVVAKKKDTVYKRVSFTFDVPKEIEKDFKAIIQMLKTAGVKEVKK